MNVIGTSISPWWATKMTHLKNSCFIFWHLLARNTQIGSIILLYSVIRSSSWCRLPFLVSGTERITLQNLSFLKWAETSFWDISGRSCTELKLATFKSPAHTHTHTHTHTQIWDIYGMRTQTKWPFCHDAGGRTVEQIGILDLDPR